MSTLARLNIVVDADAAKRQLRSLEAVAKRSAGIIQGAFQRSLAIFQGLTRQIFSLRTAFISLGAGLIVRDFIRVANTLEQVKFQMVAVTKDTKVANQILKNTRQFATEVSFSFEDLISASNRMAAQLKGDIDQVDFFLRASADVAAVTGMTVDDAASQFMRLMAGGTGAADTFRERGVLAMMGFEHGATYSLQQVQDKIKEAFEDGGSVIAGVAPQMATTFAGSLSMIGDKVFELKSRVMDAGVFDFLKDAADFINMKLDKALEDLGANAAAVGQYTTGLLEDIVMVSAGAIDGVVNLTTNVINFFENIKSAYNTFNDFTGGTLSTFGFLGFMLMGKKGGLVGVLAAVLTTVADHISAFIAEQLANLNDLAAKSLPGEVVGQSGAYDFKFSDIRDIDGKNPLGFTGKFGDRQKALEAFQKEHRAAVGDAGKLSELFNRYGVDVHLGGEHFRKRASAGRHSLFPDTFESLRANAEGFRTQAQDYRSGNVGFRHTMNEAVSAVLKKAGIDMDERGENMGPLRLSITEGNFTGASDAASEFLDFVNGRRKDRRFKGPPSVLGQPSGGTGTRTGTSTGTGKATPLAAHVLQQQLNDEIGKMIDKLHQGEMSLEQFNTQKDLMGKLIAAEIPLVGELTKEQQKEKSNIEALHKASEKYNKMLEKLGVTYSDTASKFGEGFMRAAAIAGDTAEKTMQFGQQMYQGLEDGLDAFIRTGKFNFASFMRDMAQEFMIMTAKLAMSRLVTSMFGGFMAGGGQMVPNRAYVVGERGREVFVPNEAGRLYSNDQIGGGGVTINQSFDFRNADQFTEARLRQSAAVIKEQTRQSIYQDMQDGGQISKISGRR